MSDWPSVLLPPLPTITPLSEEAFGSAFAAARTGNLLSGTVTQNQAYYFPFRIDVESTAVKMFVLIGATQNGNIDVGIYDSGWNAVVTSGATAMGTASQLQEVDITDTALKAGSYYMAFSCSSATGTVIRFAVSDEVALSNLPLYMQATAHPLPTAAATPAKNTETSPIAAIFMGVSFDTLI